jgi:hypothetical protein
MAEPKPAALEFREAADACSPSLVQCKLRFFPYDTNR